MEDSVRNSLNIAQSKCRYFATLGDNGGAQPQAKSVRNCLAPGARFFARHAVRQRGRAQELRAQSPRSL